MRLHKRKPTNHRRATAAPIVQTPTMARRPRSGAPAPTVLMAAVPAAPPAVPDFHDPSPLPGLKSLTAKDGVTVVLPAVRDHWSAEDATATQILPRVSADVPPSAQHVDPARLYYQRTFVEDDGMEPTTRGRHVLDELKALPDPAQALAAAPARIIQALGGRESEVKNPGLRVAVRMFRHARDMQRTREVRAQSAMDEADACSRMMKEFGEKWDRKIREEEIQRHGRRAVAAAEELTAAYEENRLRVEQENAQRAADGNAPLDATATTFTRGMAAKIQRMLVDEAKAGSAVSR